MSNENLRSYFDTSISADEKITVSDIDPARLEKRYPLDEQKPIVCYGCAAAANRIRALTAQVEQMKKEAM